MSGAFVQLGSDLARVRCPFALSRMRAQSLADYPGDCARDAVFALRMFEIKLASIRSIPELDGFVDGLSQGLAPDRGRSDAAPVLAARVGVRRAEIMKGRG